MMPARAGRLVVPPDLPCLTSSAGYVCRRHPGHDGPCAMVPLFQLSHGRPFGGGDPGPTTLNPWWLFTCGILVGGGLVSGGYVSFATLLHWLF